MIMCFFLFNSTHDLFYRIGFCHVIGKLPRWGRIGGNSLHFTNNLLFFSMFISNCHICLICSFCYCS